MEALFKDSVTQAGCSRHSQVTDGTNMLSIPKYRYASPNFGTLALSCSKSLWLFYLFKDLFCQLFLKPIKHAKFLLKKIFLLCEASRPNFDWVVVYLKTIFLNVSFQLTVVIYF